MKLFKETVALESNKNREDVIALIDKNIEPFHKDSSSLIFEGRIHPEGVFNIKLADSGTQYRKRVSIVIIKGLVKEMQDGKSIVNIDFTITKIIQNIIYVAGVVAVVLTVLFYMGVLNLSGIVTFWFFPLLFYSIFSLNFYLTFQMDKKKALVTLQNILS